MLSACIPIRLESIATNAALAWFRFYIGVNEAMSVEFLLIHSNSEQNMAQSNSVGPMQIMTVQLELVFGIWHLL